MTEVAQSLQKNDEWIVISLNPEKDLLESLMSKLYNRKDLGSIFKEAKINLSFFGIGVDIAGSRQITDVEVAITRMLENLKKHKKRLLVTIDEVTGTQNMRVFASSFQIMIRDELPIFLLMTGLYDNISKLENQDSMTFLYRAPKVELAPLNIGVMTDNYQNVLNLDREKALDLAKRTKGYSFAFQVLGHFVWKYEGDVERAMPEFKQYLDDYVYDKIWMELSHEDKRVLYGMASVQDDRVKTIRDYLNMETNSFNPYRKRLIRKGLVDGTEYGILKFALPLFEQYVLEYSKQDYIKEMNEEKSDDLSDEKIFAYASKKDQDITSPFFLMILSMSMHHPYNSHVEHGFQISGNTIPEKYKNYLTTCHYTDIQIGKYLQHLKEKGIYDNSMIIIVSDHDAHLKFLDMEGKIAPDLPFYIVNGGINKEDAWHEECNQLDVYTTILDIMGIESKWRGLGHTLLNKEYEFSVTDKTQELSDWINYSNFFSKNK